MIVDVWFGYLFFIYKYADISQYLAKYFRNGNKNKNKLAKYKSGVLSGDILSFRQTIRSSSSRKSGARCSGDCLWHYQEIEIGLQRYSQAVRCCQNFSLLWVSPPRRHLLVSMTLSGCWQVTPTLEAKSNVLLMHNMQDARDS